MVLSEGIFEWWFTAISSACFLWFGLLLRNNWLRAAELILLERVNTFFARLIDLLMVYLLWKGYLVAELTICIPAYFALCVGFVWTYDWRVSKGAKLLSLEKLQSFKNSELDRKEYVSHHFKWIWDKFLQWILKRDTTIFLIGSIFVLDPNFVTLILRSGSKSWHRDFLKITLPSVVYCVVAWTVIYSLAIKGIWSYEETIGDILKFIFRIITN